MWHIVILVAVQGITEFLPISSDGHLLLVAARLGGGSPAQDVHDLTIVLHFGTLLSIVVYYWRHLVELLARDRRTIGLIVVGTIPAVAAGLPLKLWGDAILASPLVAAFMLPVTGLILLAAGRAPLGEGRYAQMPWSKAFWIGLAQATALLPGISRSGTTIAAGLGVGLARGQAATFSFLLAVPAIAGAVVLTGLLSLRESGSSTPALHLAAGAVVSFVVGLGALWWLNHWLQRGWLHWFGWYCIVLGVVVASVELAGWW